VILAAVLITLFSEGAHTITDITNAEYYNLIASNTVIGRFTLFNKIQSNQCEKGRIGWDSETANWTNFADVVWGLSGNSIDIGWDQGGAGNLELTATPPSGSPVNVWTRPDDWFDTILVRIDTIPPASPLNVAVTLSESQIDGQGFRDLLAINGTRNGTDQIMITLGGYNATHQPPFSMSSILGFVPGEDEFLSSDMLAVFLQRGIVPADTDGDGLPDWWEEQYFSGSTNANPTATCSNEVNTVRDAYIAGLDPNDALSFFELSNVWNRLWWNATSGRVYNIYWTTNLLNTFQPLKTNFTGNSFTDTTHGVEEKCFYKIDVRLDE